MFITCNRCFVEKSADEFSNSSSKKNGKQSACKLCAKQLRKDWSAANAVRQKETFSKNYQRNKAARDLANKKWVAENLGRRREISRSYNVRNADKVRELGKKWRNANPDLLRHRYAHRRAAKVTATPKWADADKIREFYETADGLGMCTGDWYEVDHIVPLKSDIVCGLHCEANLQVLPRPENRSKSNRYWPDMP